MENLFTVIFVLLFIVGPIISRVLKAATKGKDGEGKSLDDRLEDAIERAKARQSHQGRRPAPPPPPVTGPSARSRPQREPPHVRTGPMAHPSASPPRPEPIPQARPPRPSPRPPVQAPRRPPAQAPQREAQPAPGAALAVGKPDARMQARLTGMEQLQNRRKKAERSSLTGQTKPGWGEKSRRSRRGIVTNLAEARKMIVYKEIMSPPKGRRGMPPLPGA